MKTDVDELLRTENVDAILVVGPAQHNPAMVYLTGGAHLTQATLIKKRGYKPVLFHMPMERDEANATGLKCVDMSGYGLAGLLKKHEGNQLNADIERYQLMLRDMGITSGRVVLYGEMDTGGAFSLFNGLNQALPDIDFVGEYGGSILLKAMSTKDPDEVERMRRMGKKTVDVVGRVASFLSSSKVLDNVLIKEDSSQLTIADVKAKIQLWLADSGIESPHGVIFAIGRDAGIPHSSGTASDPLRLGATIVFDIFPCEPGGGYYYDFTRTWCLGYAPEETQTIYNDVLDVYNKVMDELECNGVCKDYQARACELFEAMGHPTIAGTPDTQDGYVHSLGHGLGLHVHELPSFKNSPANKGKLSPGSVVTIEPGLYYPDRKIGVRLEDTVYVRPDGGIERLAEYPLNLVLPVSV